MGSANRSSKANLFRTLRVRRNAVRGFAVGVAVAVLAFVLFVLVPGSDYSPLLFVGLGFVVAFTTGFLATGVLVALTAFRLARRDEGGTA